MRYPYNGVKVFKPTSVKSKNGFPVGTFKLALKSFLIFAIGIFHFKVNAIIKTFNLELILDMREIGAKRPSEQLGEPIVGFLDYIVLPAFMQNVR